MTRKYDAIVIGAGLGGMSAATYLAKSGLSVLLCERHNIPGGYATSFVRGRYEFEIALHELSGVGPPEKRGMLYRYLEHLGVAPKIEILGIDDAYRSVFPDLDVTLPIGWEPYQDKLCETFPHEAKGIKRFLKKVSAFAKEIGLIVSAQSIGNPVTAPLRFPNAIRYLTASWGKVLARDVKDSKARAVLSQYWGYFGMAPSQATFTIFAGALAAYINLGPKYIKGRSQTLSNAFISAFEEHGGQVRFNSGVRKITTRNGKVTGVICDDGEVFESDWIVSNADPITTTRDLVGDGEVPSSFLSGLRSSTVAPSTVNVYLGVNKSKEELGLSVHENFINANDDFDAHYEATKSIGETPGMLLTCYNTVYPDISPPGTSEIVLTSLSYGEPWYKVPPHEYVDTKNRVADQLFTMAERIVPDLRDHVEVCEVATPLTNIRYAGAMGGSIYGFNFTPWDHSVLRMPHKGPLEGLYFAGAWAQPGGGFEPCMYSGQMAGDLILKKIKKAKKEASHGA